MRFKNVLALITVFMLLGTGIAWGLSAFNDEYINGNWTFENDVTFLGDIAGASLTLNGVAYTWPAADGTNGQQLTTDGSGTLSWGAAGTTAWDDITNPDANKALDFTVYYTSFDSGDTDHDMFTFQGTGNFGDYSIMKVEQLTGSPTDGTVLEVVSADTDVDALLVTANSVDVIQVLAAGTLALTGTTAISGNVDIGNYYMEIGTDPADAGVIRLANATAIEFEAAPAGTDVNALSVDASEVVQIASAGASGVTVTPDTTFTGDISAVDGSFSGNVNITGTFQQDAITAYTAATTLTVDGTGAGGVTIGGTSTGTVTLGGGATLVDLPNTVDMTISGGDFAVTDTANADMVTFTNNTMTTADLVTLAAGGTRTSNFVIAITDAATTASTIDITANTQTSGNGIQYGNTGAGLTGDAIYLAITDGAGFSGNYIHCYDGAASDFTMGRYGVSTWAGNASTDMIVVTTGDVQIDDGKLEIDTDEDDTTSVERAQATVTGPVFSVIEQTDVGAGDNQPALFVDTDTTDSGSQAILIDTEGAMGIAFSPLIAAGDGIKFDVADSYTGQGIIADLGPWLGTTGEGFINITTDSAATQEVGQAIRINLQGTGTAGTAVEGKAFHAESQAAVKAGESLVYLDTLTNTAIHIDNEGTAADGIKFDVADSYTGQGIVADLGPWLGTSSEGFIHITTDSAATIPAGQLIHMYQQGTGQHAAAIAGTMIWLSDEATAPGAGTSYLMYLDGNNIEAIHVDTGDVQIDDNLLVDGDITVATDINANGNIVGDGGAEMTGVIRDIVDAGATNPYTVTAAMSGTVFINSQAVEFDIPAAATGLEYTFIVAHASNLDIDPDAGDTIDWSTCAAGDGIRSATVGDTITLVGISAGTWMVKSVVAGDNDWSDAVFIDFE